MNNVRSYLLASAFLFCLTGVGSQVQGQTAPPAASSLRDVSGLKLNCPVTLEKKVSKPIPGLDDLLVSRESLGAVAEGVEVSIESQEFKDISILSLQGAAGGSADGISKLEGIQNPTRNIQDVVIPGADSAVRLSFKANRFGKELRVEGVYVIKGSRYWMVMCIFENTGSRSVFIGETIVKSVRFE
ncbi:hypothetical protein [Prosthecobacter fusiformis]|nr:hypothetical protein [Prosthecobacter fusiformis]